MHQHAGLSKPDADVEFYSIFGCGVVGNEQLKDIGRKQYLISAWGKPTY